MIAFDLILVYIYWYLGALREKHEFVDLWSLIWFPLTIPTHGVVLGLAMIEKYVIKNQW
jgi:hypothetical protein